MIHKEIPYDPAALDAHGAQSFDWDQYCRDYPMPDVFEQTVYRYRPDRIRALQNERSLQLLPGCGGSYTLPAYWKRNVPTHVWQVLDVEDTAAPVHAFMATLHDPTLTVGLGVRRATNKLAAAVEAERKYVEMLREEIERLQ